MTSPTNKYGLTRDIPAGVKRAVRRACGFGCVICGHAIIQYEHFNPPFAEAKEHNPEGMALLCGGCHDRKTRGFLSVSTVAQARQNPRAFQRGYAHDLFDLRSPFILIQKCFKTGS
jgi:hypothetical protein